MVKFECKSCGKCCKSFGRGFLPLYEWEVPELSKLAEARSITLNIKPFEALLDKKTNIAFASMFGMYNEPCPFLIENKCAIYENRPLVCRKFPMFFTPSFAPNHKFDPSCFTHCENFDNKKFLVDLLGLKEGEVIQKKTSEIQKVLRETYGSCYNSCFKSNALDSFISKQIKEMSQNSKIKLRRISKFDIHKYKVVPFTELLLKKGLVDELGQIKFIEMLKDQTRFDKLINQIEE